MLNSNGRIVSYFDKDIKERQFNGQNMALHCG